MTIHRFTRPLLCGLLLFFVIVVRAEDGWGKIWENKQVLARTAFRAALSAHMDEAHALFGLALLNESEGDTVGALQAWRRYVQMAPTSWPVFANWPTIVDEAETTGRYTLLQGMAEDILAAKGAPPALRSSARRALAQAQDRAGQFAEGASQFAAPGYVRQWRIIGPFDNEAKSGFDKVLPPEQRIDYSKTYTGSDGLSITWHPLQIVTREGRCKVGEALSTENDSEDDESYSGGAISFAATAIYAPRPLPVLLHFDPQGASKILFNGQLVFVDELERESRNALADPFCVKTNLRQGWNTILVKLGSEEPQVSFQMRFTTCTGDDLHGLTVDPAHADNTLSPLAGALTPAPTAAATPGKVETTIAAYLRTQPASPELALALGRELTESQDYVAAIAALRAALKKTPEASWLHWALNEALARDHQDDEARNERVMACRQNNRLFEAVMAEWDEQARTRPQEQRLPKLKELQLRFPNCASLLWQLASALDDDHQKSEALATAGKAVAIEAGSRGEMRYMTYLNDNSSPEAAVNRLTLALRRAPHDVALLKARAEQLASKDSDIQAIAAYRELMAHDAPLPEYHHELATCFTAMGHKQQALQEWKIIHTQRPYDCECCRHLAQLYQELGDKKAALAFYQEVARLGPGDSDLRAKIRSLTGASPALDLIPATPADPILKAAATLKQPAETPATILLYETRKVVYPDFSSEFRHHLIVKVFDDAGVKEFQQINFFDEGRVEKATLIKPNGKVEDMTNKMSDANQFPSLTPGDIIDVSTTGEEVKHGALSHHFWSWQNIPREDSNVQLFRYVLMTPAHVTFRVATHGAIPPPSVKDTSGWHIQEWRLPDLPADRSEVCSPAIRDRVPWLDISDILSWHDIARWYDDLSAPRRKPDAEVRAKAEELTKDAKSEEEKIRAITTFVARKIQYQSRPFRMSAFVPTKGNEVLRDLYGDCKDKAALLTALLAAVNIPADIVLVNDREDGITPFLPSPRFTHAINRIRTEHGPLWVDTTAEQGSFGDLPLTDQGVPALIIDGATTELTTTPVLPIVTEKVRIALQVTLDAQGKAQGTATVSFSNSYNSALRTSLKQLTSSQLTNTLNLLMKQLLRDAIIDENSLENLNDPEKPLLVHGKWHNDNYANAAGDFLLAPMPWSAMDRFASYLSEKPRAHDLNTILTYGRHAYYLQLTLPAGYTAVETAANREYTNPWGSGSITTQVKGNMITKEIIISTTTLRIAAADYSKFLEFMHQITKEMNTPLMLKKQ